MGELKNMLTALNLTLFIVFVFAGNLGCCFSYRTTTVNNQIDWDSPIKILECKTSNIEVWSNGNGLPLNGTNYDVTINETGNNKTFRCSWKFELRGELFPSLTLFSSYYSTSTSISWQGDYGKLSFNQEGSRLVLNETYLRNEVEEIYFNCTIWNEGCKISQGCCHGESEIEKETGTSNGINSFTITIIVVSSLILLASVCGCFVFCSASKCLGTKR